ncbi:MAG: D-alanyl-D-alanine carboxypeptidase/D-alanyl-D-alanine-endopeptidase, partial [Gemmatimonadota bacterium]
HFSRFLAAAAVMAGLMSIPHVVRAQTLPDALKTRLQKWYRSTSRSAPGNWAIAIADQQGAMLWSVKPEQQMIPASTVKLLTTGFARTVLGSDARRSTRVVGTGHLDEATGDWAGYWALELNGDPSLENPSGEGPKLYDLAEQLAGQGIRRLRGPMQVVSADGPADAKYPAAWSPANWGSIYAPLIGPMTIHENVVWLTIRPGSRAGARAIVEGTSPSGLDALVTVHATTTSGFRSRLNLTRMADGGYLINGRIGVHAFSRRLISVMSDPKAVVASTWARALSQAGIQWDRTPVTQAATTESSRVLAEINSAPFDTLATEINRRSLNIGAELLLEWAAGRERGPQLLTEHVQQVTGIADGAHLVDGSGLSQMDRVAPATFISYLAHFPGTPAGRNFPMLLPANGVGTLARLNSGLAAPGVVHAKTGTLANASTLVGYLGRKDGVLLISLMYNGGRTHSARRAQWTLFRLLGADGVTIPADSTESATDSDQLGGETVTK